MRDPGPKGSRLKLQGSSLRSSVVGLAPGRWESLRLAVPRTPYGGTPVCMYD